MQPRHIAALDGVRGIAILMVICCHLEYVGITAGSSRPEHLVRQTMWMGWSGVDLFFVLSGFLITGILLDKKHAPNRVHSFYARRLLRIAPLYYLVLLFVALAAPYIQALREHAPNGTGLISYLFYFQNFWMPIKDPKHGLLGHFWSLAIEEQFYLVWPWLVWRASDKTLWRTCLGLIGTAFVLRCFAMPYYAGSAIVLMNPFMRMDSLLMGALGAIILRNERVLSRVRRWIPVVGIGSIAAFLIGTVKTHDIWTRGAFTQTFGFTLLAVAYGCLVLWAAMKNDSGFMPVQVLRFAPLRSIGRYAYGMYVYHIFVFIVGLEVFGARAHGWLACALYMTAIYGVAAVSYESFEKRFLKLKDRNNTKNLDHQAVPAAYGDERSVVQTIQPLG